MSIAQFLRLWRLMVAIVVFQMAGGLIGIVIGPRHDSFMNFWTGAALAGVPGFAVGYLLQINGNRDKREWIAGARFIALLVVMLTGAALFDFQCAREESRKLEEIRRLAHERILYIDVYDDDERQTRISDPAALAAFGEGIADAVPYSPNHPTYTSSWYLVVQTTLPYELELHLEAGFRETVTGYIVTKSGTSTLYYGS